MLNRKDLITDIRWTIAQALLAYLMLPLIGYLLSLIRQDWESGLVEMLVGFCSEVPFVGGATDAISTYLTTAGSVTAQLDFLNTLVNRFTPLSFISAVIVGLWAGICFKFGELIGVRGIPIFPSIAAVFVCSALSRFLDVFADISYICCTLIFSFVLNGVLTLLTAEKKGVAFMLGMGCETVAAVFSSAYTALLIMVMQGLIPNFWMWMGLQLCLVIPLTLFLAIDAWFYRKTTPF